MTVKLYGVPLSAFLRAVMVTLKEIGVPYEIVPVDLFKREHKDEEYLENMHPFGQVPVLVRIFLPSTHLSS